MTGPIRTALIHLLGGYVSEEMYPGPDCQTGAEWSWMLKGCCPDCLDHPIEALSTQDYMMKYPARNKLTIGRVSVHLCDHHLRELYDNLTEYYQKPVWRGKYEGRV